MSDKMLQFDEILDNVKSKNPLVHNITNYVTVNDCANILLACGGSPIMADDALEVEDITTICNALVINIGTLNSRTIESMLLAGKKANELNHPVVLDPVGAGASKLRTATIYQLMKELHFAVIRGNISEIKTISEGSGSTKGVDADIADAITYDNIEEAIKFAQDLSDKTGSIIAITGAIDIVADRNKAYIIQNGHPVMSEISGTGCMLTSIIGAYCAANPQRLLEATATAVCVMGLCGELAYEKMQQNDGGTASLKMYLIDYMGKMNVDMLHTGAKIESRQRGTSIIDKKSMLLYAVTDRTWLGDNSLVMQVEQAILGGATFIQLREKELCFQEFVKIAAEVKVITDQYKIPFVINDNVEVAIAVNADGVHIGQKDEEIKLTRKKLGPSKIIGVSAHNTSEAIKAQENGADYIGVGAMFHTSTKLDADTVTFKTLKDICQVVTIPVIAIGGVSKDNILELSGSGIDGVAVVSAIFAQKNITKATSELLRLSSKLVG